MGSLEFVCVAEKIREIYSSYSGWEFLKVENLHLKQSKTITIDKNTVKLLIWGAEVNKCTVKHKSRENLVTWYKFTCADYVILNLSIVGSLFLV